MQKVSQFDPDNSELFVNLIRLPNADFLKCSSTAQVGPRSPLLRFIDRTKIRQTHTRAQGRTPLNE